MAQSSTAVRAAAALAGSSDALRPAPALAWYGLAVLLMTTLFAFVVRQMLSLISPSLQTSLGFSDMQIGPLQGLGLAVFASLASYPMGWLADRFGRPTILAIGVGCSMGVAMSSAMVWFPLALPRAFGVTPATVGLGLGTAITVATLVGVVLPAVLLKVRGRAEVSEPVAVARIFVALPPCPRPHCSSSPRRARPTWSPPSRAL